MRAGGIGAIGRDQQEEARSIRTPLHGFDAAGHGVTASVDGGSFGITTFGAHPMLLNTLCRVDQLPSVKWLVAVISRMYPSASTPIFSVVPSYPLASSNGTARSIAARWASLRSGASAARLKSSVTS